MSRAIHSILSVLISLTFQMAFLVGVTPVMHNFWDHPADSAEYNQDLIQFMKVRTAQTSLCDVDSHL